MLRMFEILSLETLSTVVVLTRKNKKGFTIFDIKDCANDLKTLLKKLQPSISGGAKLMLRN